MMARTWHGWTLHQNADAYESLLKGDIMPGIEALGMAGFYAIPRRIE